MSDQETILRTLRRAEARIRADRWLGRAALGVSLWIGAAILLKGWDLARPLDGDWVRAFWFAWSASLVGYLWWSRSPRRSLEHTAAEVDRRGRLDDELLSACWFLDHPSASPWTHLHIRRAARQAVGLDLKRLFPRAVPKASYAAAAGLVLLVALSIHPLPLAPTLGYSAETPSAFRVLSQEIDDLLLAADALRPDTTLEEFRALIDSIERVSESDALEMASVQAEERLSSLEDRLAEGNLSVSNLLDGLQEMGADLMASTDTAQAGQALAEGDLEGAAQALDDLASELGEGRAPAPDLGSALAEAGQSQYSGLEDLASDLGQASNAMEDGSLEGLEQALRGAADSLTDLGNVIDSQQLRNQAASRMQALEQLLRQQMAEAAESGEGIAGDSGEGQPSGQRQGPAQEGVPGDGSPQAGMPEGAASDSPGGTSGDAQAAVGEMASPPGGQAVEAGGDGAPLGLGFSPGPTQGPPTSLEVQLQEELVETAPIEASGSSEPEQEASRQEGSRLDYSAVASELERARQQLLHQDRIPREYRTLIRDYFEAIQGEAEP